jgi:hypothetical protein
MIINVAPVSARAMDLPLYVGASAGGDLVGTGPESIQVFQIYLPIADYVASLVVGSVTNTPGIILRRESFGFSETLRRVLELVSLPEADDFGRLRPSVQATQTARKILVRMLQSGTTVPMPEEVATDRDGDLRITWENGGRSLELVCPYEGDRRPYIYYSDDRDHEIAYDMAAYRVGRLLSWLLGLIDTFPR